MAEVGPASTVPLPAAHLRAFIGDRLFKGLSDPKTPIGIASVGCRLDEWRFQVPIAYD
jgi:hypothetical protein